MSKTEEIKGSKSQHRWNCNRKNKKRKEKELRKLKNQGRICENSGEAMVYCGNTASWNGG